jgi:2-amino-4-hydroxy-6-hydroxymethyldihydropteridine diphosphokinase
MIRSYIGLGANLGDATATLKSAVAALRTLADSHVFAVSRLYRSAPLGPAGQPDYWNAALLLETTLTPHALLAALQAIENEHGRVREVRWGARTLDLDLLLYGHDEIATADLVVPHPELASRNFVVHPLLDINAELRLPDGRLLASLPSAHDDNGLAASAGRHWAD